MNRYCICRDNVRHGCEIGAYEFGISLLYVFSNAIVFIEYDIRPMIKI